MTHVTTDERLALIESAGAPNHPHLATCARCRAEVEEGRIALGDVRLSEVPEPSPLFWDHLSARVSERVAAGPETRRRPVAAWRVLVPTAVGVIAVVLAVWIDRGAFRGPVSPAPAPGVASAETVVGPVGDDESWSMLGQMAAEFDVDTLSDSLGTSEAAGAESAVYQLNARERATLAELLRTEMGQGPATE
jgi:hypothetical protein